MSTDRSLRVQLPRLRFAPTALPPIRPPRPGPGEPSREADVAAEEDAGSPYAAMLPAGRGRLGGDAGRMIVTLFTGDQAGLLAGHLRRLAAPGEVGERWRLRAFTVEASLSASLAGVGALAVVVQPVFWEDRNLSPADLARLAGELRRELRPRAPLRAPDVSSAVPTGLQWDVQPIAPGDDLVLYAGRQFREMRFRIGCGRVAAGRAARVIDRFSNVLGDQEVPLAYLHYPLHWAGEADHQQQWLRMAYAVADDPAADLALEMAAYSIAEAEDVALCTYDPTRPGTMENRFVTLREPPERGRRQPGDPSRGTAAGAEGTGRPTLALCIRGRARPGLVGRLMRGLSGASVYGCTMAVLYGNTVCNVVLDHTSGEEMHRRLADLAPDVTVVPYRVDAHTPIVGGAGDDDMSCWVAWCSGDQIGLMQRVVEAVYGVFRDRRVEVPNVNYAISRLLADGGTCAGKVHFVCSRREAEQVGLAPHHDAPGDVGAAPPEGWSALREAVREAVRPALAGWRPPHREWLARPVEVGTVEPSEEPWARLVVPEGAVAEVHDAPVRHRYPADIAVPRRRRSPVPLVPDLVGAAHALVRLLGPDRLMHRSGPTSTA
jgi:hypothetical protein